MLIVKVYCLSSPETESKLILIYFVDRMGEIAFVQSVAVYQMQSVLISTVKILFLEPQL